MSVGFFIEDDTKDLLMDIYTFNKELQVFFRIDWNKYNKFIKVLDELDFNKFFQIEALGDRDKMEIEVKKIANEYELSVSEFNYSLS